MIKPEQVKDWIIDIRDRENGNILIGGCTITDVQGSILYITTPGGHIFTMDYYVGDIWSYDVDNSYTPYIILDDLQRLYPKEYS
jgi:hypothetical protein